MRVYVAGPVRGEPAPEGALEAVRAALAEMGHEVVNEPPPSGGVPALPQAETRAFVTEVDRMLEADLLVAEASSPSLGVGWAVSWFLAKGRLAVVCCRRERRAALSVLLAGNPSPWQRIVLYERAADLPQRLAEVLRR